MINYAEVTGRVPHFSERILGLNMCVRKIGRTKRVHKVVRTKTRILIAIKKTDRS